MLLNAHSRSRETWVPGLTRNWLSDLGKNHFLYQGLSVLAIDENEFEFANWRLGAWFGQQIYCDWLGQHFVSIGYASSSIYHGPLWPTPTSRPCATFVSYAQYPAGS